MSYVRFASPSDEVDLRGSERYYASRLCKNIALGVIDGAAGAEPSDWFVKALEPRVTDLHFLAITLRSGSLDHVWLDPSGGRHGVGETLLNTAVDIGGDAVALLARLDGYCESHCYVEGEHRAWLADVIKTGRRQNILRAGMRWEEVESMLRSRADEPVVCSFSVSNGFPNAEVAGLDDYDFDVLDRAEQWDRSLAGIRKVRWLGIAPQNIRTQGWSTGKSLFDLAAMWAAVASGG